MSTVYIVHNKGFDLSGTKVFGEQIIMFDGQIEDIFNLTKLAYVVKNKLVGFTKDDYLVLSGNMIINALAVACVMQNYGTCNVLLFDIKRAEYIPRTLSKHHLDIGE